MPRNPSHLSLSAVALGLLLATTIGCTQWKPRLAAQPSTGEARRQRHDQAVQAFEQKRDRAQLEAALDRWQQGDVAGCELRLRELLARQPDFIDAHVQLAELAWSCDNAAEAESEYRAALERAPDRVDVHHALGLLLEATGRSDDAQSHLARAATAD